MMWNPSVNAIWVRACAELRGQREAQVHAATSRSRRWSGSAVRVLAPVDLRGVRAVHHLGTAHARDVRPSPVDDASQAGADAGHQRGVHAEPGRERDGPWTSRRRLAHRGDRRAAADHRHDALVLVLERLPRARRRSRRAGSSRPTRRSGAPRSRAVASGSSVRAGDVRDVADRVDAGEALHRQVGLHVDAAATPLGDAGRGGERGSRDAAAPHHAPGRDLGAVAEGHVPAVRPRSPWCRGAARHPCAAGPSRVVVRALRERSQQRVAEVDDVHARRRDREVAVLDRHRPVDHVGERAGRLDAGRRRRRRRRS